MCCCRYTSFKTKTHFIGIAWTLLWMCIFEHHIHHNVTLGGSPICIHEQNVYLKYVSASCLACHMPQVWPDHVLVSGRVWEHGTEMSAMVTVQLHIAALAMQTLTAPLIHTLASFPTFCHLQCVELQYKDVDCLLFGSTCSCSSSASPEGIAH